MAHSHAVGAIQTQHVKQVVQGGLDCGAVGEILEYILHKSMARTHVLSCAKNPPEVSEDTVKTVFRHLRRIADLVHAPLEASAREVDGFASLLVTKPVSFLVLSRQFRSALSTLGRQCIICVEYTAS